MSDYLLGVFSGILILGAVFVIFLLFLPPDSDKNEKCSNVPAVEHHYFYPPMPHCQKSTDRIS